MSKLLFISLVILPFICLAEITFPYFQDFESPHSVDNWTVIIVSCYPAPSLGNWAKVQGNGGYYERGYQRLQSGDPDGYAYGRIRLCSDAVYVNSGESLMILTHFTTLYSGTGASCNIGLLNKGDETKEYNLFWIKTVATQTEPKPLDRIEYSDPVTVPGYYRIFWEINAAKYQPGYQEFYFNIDNIKVKLMPPGNRTTEIQSQSLSRIKAAYK